METINPTVFIHPQAIVAESAVLGAGTRVWAFAHILPGACIGKECNICDNTFIENDVSLGDRVTIKCGVYLWDGIRLADDVFVGPNATFTNDKFPRSKQYSDEFAQTFVDEGASIGANATILPGIRIGRRAMIGAGAVVTNNVPPNAIVAGNPGQIIGYVDTHIHSSGASVIPDSEGVHESRVRGVKFYRLPDIQDLRGNLTVAEYKKALPFRPRRFFLVYQVPSEKVRGEHAHKECHQFLACVRGQVSVVVDDGKEREEFLLDRSYFGLYVPPMVWSVQYKYSPDAVLLVLASGAYDPDDYIRDYDEFLEMVNAT